MRSEERFGKRSLYTLGHADFFNFLLREYVNDGGMLLQHYTESEASRSDASME